MQAKSHYNRKQSLQYSYDLHLPVHLTQVKAWTCLSAPGLLIIHVGTMRRNAACLLIIATAARVQPCSYDVLSYAFAQSLAPPWLQESYQRAGHPSVS